MVAHGPAARLDDTKKFFYTEQPNAGVKLPATGPTIRVLSESGTTITIRVGMK